MQQIRAIVRGSLKWVLQCLGYFSLFKKNVLCVVHNQVMLDYADPIYEAINDDKRINVRLCFVMPELFDIKALKKYKRHYRWIPLRCAKWFEWDLIVYPDHFRNFNNAKARFYTGHGFDNAKKVNGENYLYGPNAFDAKGKCIYDKFFMPSHYVCSQVQSIYPDVADRLRVCGHMRLDHLVSQKIDKSAFYQKYALDPERKTIMLTSTWRDDSLINTAGMEFLEQLNEVAQHYNVIISIHLNNYEKKHCPNTDWKATLAGYRQKNVYIMNPGEDNISCLPYTDLLIVDQTSVLLYYPVFARPVIYYEAPGVSIFEHSLTARVRDVAYRVGDLKQIRQTIDKAFAEFDPAPMQRVSHLIDDCIGQAKVRVQNEIYETLGLTNK